MFGNSVGMVSVISLWGDMEHIMTGGTPADLHNILSVQAKNALIFHIFWDWTERQNREMDENDPETDFIHREHKSKLGVYHYFEEEK
mgnify:FL=1